MDTVLKQYILQNVNSIKDLINLCLTNKEIKHFYENYKKSIFLSLIKNKNFRNSFYNTFNKFIQKDTTTPKDKLDEMKWHHISKLLKWYPVGNMFKETDKAQIELLNVFTTLTNDQILRYQSYLKYYFKLFFFPSNYIEFLDDPKTLFKLDTLNLNLFPFKNKILDIWIFHLTQLQKIESKIECFSSMDPLTKLSCDSIIKIFIKDIKVNIYLRKYHLKYFKLVLDKITKKLNISNNVLESINKDIEFINESTKNNDEDTYSDEDTNFDSDED